MKTGILWFRTDLRLRDNETLVQAVKNLDAIIPVYVLHEPWMANDEWGFQRTANYRMQFILQCLADLKEHLMELGSDLIVLRGDAVTELNKIAAQYACKDIYTMHTYTSEEQSIEQQLSKKYHLHQYHTNTMIHPEDVPFDLKRIPEVFTAFRQKVEKYVSVRKPFAVPASVPSPTLPDTVFPTLKDLGYELPIQDKRAVMTITGGATAAWEQLNHYFWDKELLSVYKETRNGMIGADYSSKFSPWLAQGCISARAIVSEIEDYENEVEKNESTYWLKFELLWRDFFKFTAIRYGNKIFQASGIKDQSRKWRYKSDLMERWTQGETGNDFVDANMKELLHTGFMSNRGRQNVASYLVHQLQLDWRAGAAWFESMLIDYDVESNYGNWIYAAGVGNDPRDRVFNMERQADMYDKKGEFRTLWLQPKP